MKRTLAVLTLLMVCLLFAMPAYGETANELETTILADIDAANTREALLENYERIAFRTEFFNNDMPSFSVYTYADQEKYVYIEDGFLTIEMDGQLASYYEADQLYDISIYVGENAYEEDRINWMMNWYEFDPYEQIIKMTEENGFWMLETEIVEENDVGIIAENCGYAADEIKKVFTTYTVDAQSYCLCKMDGFLVDAEGAMIPFITMVKEENVEEYEVPSDFLAAISSEVKRTITVIENPGTEQEIAHEYQVPSGVGVYPVLSSEYEQALYADPECTTEFQSNEDFTSDVVVYVKK